MHVMTRRTAITATAMVIGSLSIGSKAAIAAGNRTGEKIDPYRPRFGRSRPLIAVVGLNEGTDICDFGIPYGVMARSGVAEVVSVAVKPGPVKLGPLIFQLQSTIDGFDAHYPEGADYLFVPAVANSDDPKLASWIKAQGGKGCTVISICYGALVVANAGLFDGHRATSHYSNEEMRAKRFPNVKWQTNTRYVADGKLVSSAGVSASMPTSIALVEAIAGPAKAAQVARDVGIDDWSSKHDSDAFRGKMGDAGLTGTDRQPETTVGIPVRAGDDEIALAMTAEAYSRNGRTMAVAVAANRDPVRLAHGLVVLPDRVSGGAKSVDRTLQPLSANQSTRALDIALADIASRHGRQAALNVALYMEYPGFAQ